MASRHPNWKSERGAMLMHIALSMLGVLAIGALVIDHGVMWAARRQAQNSADAAALAGAVSLAFDGSTNWDRARLAARTVGQANQVFGATLNITEDSGFSDDITQDISFPPCPPGSPGGPDRCVRVNVYRQDGNLPLPTFLARLFGRTSQNVRATATAKVLAANSTECLKPFAVADRWDESTSTGGSPGGIQNPQFDPDWNMNSTFNSAQDLYLQAGPDSPGTGFRLYDSSGSLCCDYGQMLFMKQDIPNSAAWHQIADLGNCGNSASCYRASISGCYTGSLGDTVGVVPGTKHGPTRMGVEDLIGQDPNAFWYHPTAPLGSGRETYNPQNVPIPPSLAQSCPQGCIYSPQTGINKSPRIGAVPIINPVQLASPPNGDVTIINLLGFFFTSVTGNGNDQTVNGRIVTIPGTFNPSAAQIDENAAFLSKIMLVR